MIILFGLYKWTFLKTLSGRIIYEYYLFFLNLGSVLGPGSTSPWQFCTTAISETLITYDTWIGEFGFENALA